MNTTTKRWVRGSVFFFLTVTVLGNTAARTAGRQTGEVIFAKGVATAQLTGGPVRFLGRGASFETGDVITTARRSFATLRLADDTRITLRPRTTFLVEEFDTGASAPGVGTASSASLAGRARAVLRLFRGGLRAVTGFISKRNPEAFRLRTRVATIGIRGTSFEARLCETDCSQEAKRARRPPDPSSTTAVVARVVLLRGRLQATGEFANPRPVALGGSLYDGDLIETGPRAVAVIQYRDRTRTTVVRNSALRIDRHRYRPGASGGSRSVLTFLRGGLRILTGLIGRTNRAAFALRTSVATIGIRGTGFDLSCGGNCATSAAALPLGPAQSPISLPECAVTPAAPGSGDASADRSLAASVWDGSVGVGLDRCVANVATGQHLAVTGPGAQAHYLTAPSRTIEGFDGPLGGPRPDSPEAVDPSLRNPFESVRQDAPLPGLYVSVYEGDVTVSNDSGSRIDLGSGETAFAGGAGGQPVVRIAGEPNFSRTPDPGLFENPDIRDLFQLFDDPNRAGQTQFQCVL